MILRLGYVQTPVTLDDITYCHKVTFTYYEKMAPEKKVEKLDFILRWNLEELKNVLKYPTLTVLKYNTSLN